MNISNRFSRRAIARIVWTWIEATAGGIGISIFRRTFSQL
jgi:hypothetical protein